MRCEHFFYCTPLVTHKFHVKQEKDKNTSQMVEFFLWMSKCVAWDVICLVILKTQGEDCL